MECIHRENPRRVLRAVVGRDVRVVEQAPLSQWILETAAGDVFGSAGLSWMEREGLKREAGSSLRPAVFSPASTSPRRLVAPFVKELLTVRRCETTDGERGRRRRIRG